MHTKFVPVICVSVVLGIFVTSSLAESPVASHVNTPGNAPPGAANETATDANGDTPEWLAADRAGLAANHRRSYEEALAFFLQGWNLSRLTSERGASATNLGVTYRHLGRVKEAKQWLERARQEWSVEPRQGDALAVTTTDLADLYRNTGNYATAEHLLRETLASASCTQTCSPDSKGGLRNNLADLLREEGRSDEAQKLFLQAIQPGDGEPLPVRLRIAALIGLADIGRQNGDYPNSIARWNQAIDTCRQVQDLKAEAVALRGLGMTWLQSGTAARAEPLLRRSLSMMEDNPDTPQEQLAGTLSGIGDLYRSENKLALAEDEWSRAMEIDRKALGEDHPQVAVLMDMLADVYSSRGEFELARDYATKASASMSKYFGENSIAEASSLANRALVEQRASDLETAAKDYRQALRITSAHPEGRSLGIAIAERYATVLKAMHRGREAKTLLTQLGQPAQTSEGRAAVPSSLVK